MREEEAVNLAAAPTKIRVYVGGLGESVTRDDLRKIFSSMGTVNGVDIVRTKGRSFAYIDFFPSSDKSVTKLFSTYNGCVWKGGRLKLEKAKEDYLSHLRREWEEDAELASISHSISADTIKNIPSSEKPKDTSKSEKKQLKIFFPKLQKVKSLPFSGTGKHKYSFQRVEVPSLPAFFCDCEVHSGPLLATKEKHTCSVESQDGAMNEEEINMMNSVMNKLFQTENNLTTLSGIAGLAKDEDSVEPIEDPQFDVNEMDLEADEDNLIINVASGGNNKSSLSVTWEKETISTKQKSIFNERQTSRDGQSQDAVKRQKNNSILPCDRKKAIIQEENRRDESVPAEAGGNGHSGANSNGSGTQNIFGAQHIEPKLGNKQSTSSYSWSQKSSWKKLVGEGSNSAFSVSNILPGISSNKEKLSGFHDPNVSNPANSDNLNLKRDKKLKGRSSKVDLVAKHTEDQPAKLDVILNKSDGPTEGLVKEQVDIAPPKKKRKTVIHKESGRNGANLAGPDNEGQPQINADGPGTEIISGGQLTEPDFRAKHSASASWSQISQDLLVGDGSKSSFAVPNSLTGIASVKEDQFRSESDTPSAPKSNDREIHISAMDKDVGGQSSETEKAEGNAEAQPAKLDAASSKSGRGSSWLHKSSWTQLLKEKNSSFSITQILPDITFEKHERIGPSNADVLNFSCSKLTDFVNQGNGQPSANDSSALGISKEKNTVQHTSENSQETAVGCHDKASTPLVNRECEPATEKPFSGNVIIGETCSFMRSAGSLKTWANAKKSLSGSRKRKLHEMQ